MIKILTGMMVVLVTMGCWGQEIQQGLLQWYGPLIVTVQEGIDLLSSCPTNQDCFPASLISIAFDDGYASVYEKAFPIMLRYKMTGTVFMIANRIGLTEEFLTLAQLQELHKAGWEISSHSFSHPSLVTVSQEELEKELVLSKQTLQEQGFPATGFAYPFGHLTPNIVQEVSRYYSYGRGAYKEYEGINPLPLLKEGPGSRYELKCVIVDEYPFVDIIKGFIDRVAIEGGWLILTFHKIADVPRWPYVYPTHAFQEIIRYLREELHYCTLQEFEEKRCAIRREWNATREALPADNRCCGEILVISQEYQGGAGIDASIIPKRVCEDLVFLEFKILSQMSLLVQKMTLIMENPDGSRNLSFITQPIHIQPRVEHFIRIAIGHPKQTGLYRIQLVIESNIGHAALSALIFIGWH